MRSPMMMIPVVRDKKKVKMRPQVPWLHKHTTEGFQQLHIFTRSINSPYILGF